MLKSVLGILVLVVLLFWAAPLFGQIEIGEIPSDNIDTLEYQRPVWEYVAGMGFLIAVLGIGFKASKRAHGT